MCVRIVWPVCILKCACVCVCVCAFMTIYVNTEINARTYVCAYVTVCACIFMYMCVCAYVCGFELVHEGAWVQFHAYLMGQPYLGLFSYKITGSLNNQHSIISPHAHFFSGSVNISFLSFFLLSLNNYVLMVTYEFMIRNANIFCFLR